MTTRVQILAEGIVQGVGFRPFIYSLAVRESLKGKVLNTPEGVLIDVEGDQKSIERLLAAIEANPPPLSRIESISCRALPDLAHYPDFRIVESNDDGNKFVPISPDFATCTDCLRELLDPRDRRFRYPFINCTHADRASQSSKTSYDRDRTTMRDFECARRSAETRTPSHALPPERRHARLCARALLTDASE